MTATLEAFVLPLVFLTVVLLGGLRVATPILMGPPTLFALVMALLLLRLLVQSGALAPVRLLSSTRSTLANLNGFVVLITLWMASAQTLALLTPDSGVPRLAVSLLFLVVLINTSATAPDREGLLRSLAVIFGATFIVKFVVLYELSAPGTGWVKRVVQALIESVTLGALIQEVPHRATGYLALFTVVLFLFGVFLLPAQAVVDDRRLVRRATRELDQL